MSEFRVHVVSVSAQKVFLKRFGLSVAFINCYCGNRKKVICIGPVALLNVKGKFFEWKLNQCSLLV